MYTPLLLTVLSPRQNSLQKQNDVVSSPFGDGLHQPGDCRIAWTDGRSGSDAAFPWKKTIVEGAGQP